MQSGNYIMLGYAMLFTTPHYTMLYYITYYLCISICMDTDMYKSQSDTVFEGTMYQPINWETATSSPIKPAGSVTQSQEEGNDNLFVENVAKKTAWTFIKREVYEAICSTGWHFVQFSLTFIQNLFP